MWGEGEYEKRSVLPQWLKVVRKGDDAFLGTERRMAAAFESCSVRGGGSALVKAGGGPSLYDEAPQVEKLA